MQALASFRDLKFHSHCKVLQHKFRKARSKWSSYPAFPFGEQHKGLFPPRGRGWIDHCLGRSVIVITSTEVSGVHFDVGHVLRVHLDKRVRHPVHHELVVLVEVGILPDDIRAAVITELWPLSLLGFLARGDIRHREQAAAHEAGPAGTQIIDRAADLADTAPARAVPHGVKPHADIEIRNLV